MNIVRTQHPIYPWRYMRDTVHRIKGMPRGVNAKLYGKDQLYAKIHWGYLHILEGYQFDGCTCAVDFTRALQGCGAHDALLQILAENPKLFSEQVAHDAMRSIHEDHFFALAGLYHWAVSSWPRKLWLKLQPERK